MSERQTTYTKVIGKLIRSTNKAYLIKIVECPEGAELPEPRTLWIPISQIDRDLIDPHSDAPNSDWFYIADWLLQKNQLI